MSVLIPARRTWRWLTRRRPSPPTISSSTSSRRSSPTSGPAPGPRRRRRLTIYFVLVIPLGSVADPGCLSHIPDPNFFPSRNQVQKEFKYFLPKKLFLKLSSQIRITDVHPGSWSRIRIQIFSPSWIRISDPGVKKSAETGSGSALLPFGSYRNLLLETARPL